MKNTSLRFASVLFVLIAGITFQTSAQQKSYLRSAGFQLQQLGGDFGIGLHHAFPIYKKAVFLHTSVGWNWHEHFSAAENGATWTSYQNLRLGLGGRYPVAERISCYSEGGFIVVRADEVLASTRNGFGGYGLFGFEFMFAPRAGYFFELGGNGVHMEADRIAGKPLLANGFTINAGYRMKF